MDPHILGRNDNLGTDERKQFGFTSPSVLSGAYLHSVPQTDISNYIEAFTDYLLAYNNSIKLLISSQHHQVEDNYGNVSQQQFQPANSPSSMSYQEYVANNKIFGAGGECTDAENKRLVSNRGGMSSDKEGTNITEEVQSGSKTKRNNEELQILKTEEAASNMPIVRNVRVSGHRSKCKGPKQALHTLGKGSSKYRGVSWHKDNQRWRATIFKDNKPVHIGYFEREQEAARAYDKEALKVRASNAILNYPAIEYPEILLQLHRDAKMELDDSTWSHCTRILQQKQFAQTKGREALLNDEQDSNIGKRSLAASLNMNPAFLPVPGQLVPFPQSRIAQQLQPPYISSLQDSWLLEQDGGSWMRKRMRRSYSGERTSE